MPMVQWSSILLKQCDCLVHSAGRICKCFRKLSLYLSLTRSNVLKMIKMKNPAMATISSIAQSIISYLVRCCRIIHIGSIDVGHRKIGILSKDISSIQFFFQGLRLFIGESNQFLSQFGRIIREKVWIWRNIRYLLSLSSFMFCVSFSHVFDSCDYVCKPIGGVVPKLCIYHRYQNFEDLCTHIVEQEQDVWRRNERRNRSYWRGAFVWSSEA